MINLSECCHLFAFRELLLFERAQTSGWAAFGNPLYYIRHSASQRLVLSRVFIEFRLLISVALLHTLLFFKTTSLPSFTQQPQRVNPYFCYVSLHQRHVKPFRHSDTPLRTSRNTVITKSNTHSCVHQQLFLALSCTYFLTPNPFEAISLEFSRSQPFVHWYFCSQCENLCSAFVISQLVYK